MLPALVSMFLAIQAPGMPPAPNALPPGVPQMATIPLAVEPPLVDFGRVAPGTKHPAKFLLRNVGPAPLTIARAQPSCKCTDISDIAGKTIPPGGTLELTAALLVPKSPGDKDAKVMISVQGMDGLVIAKMVADVTQPVRSEPAYVDALKGVSEGTVKLSSLDGKPFRVTAAGGRPPVFVGFDPAKDAPRAQYEIRWRTADIASGQLPQWWVVDTDRADCPQIPLRIRHESTGMRFDSDRNGRFWFPPESIVLAGVVKAGTPVQLSTTIEHLNPAAQGRVTNPQWGSVKAVTVPGGEGTAAFVSATPRAGDFVDVAFSFTPAVGRSGPMYVPVMLETPTGKGPVFVAVTVVP
jgi:Protein of unknown function (DUF1573)